MTWILAGLWQTKDEVSDEMVPGSSAAKEGGVFCVIDVLLGVRCRILRVPTSW